MLCSWLIFEASKNIGKVDIWFPIVGHSFLPAYQIFGKLETYFKDRSVIQSRQDYINVISKYSLVTRLGENSCPVKNGNCTPQIQSSSQDNGQENLVSLKVNPKRPH